MIARVVDIFSACLERCSPPDTAINRNCPRNPQTLAPARFLRHFQPARPDSAVVCQKIRLPHPPCAMQGARIREAQNKPQGLFCVQPGFAPPRRLHAARIRQAFAMPQGMAHVQPHPPLRENAMAPALLFMLYMTPAPLPRRPVKNPSKLPVTPVGVQFGVQVILNNAGRGIPAMFGPPA